METRKFMNGTMPDSVYVFVGMYIKYEESRRVRERRTKAHF